MTTKIQWCDETLNPIRAEYQGRTGWHCEKRGPGCVNCYAERANITARFHRGTGLPFAVDSRTLVGHYLDVKTLLRPMLWRRTRSIFWCDMTDLFGEWVPADWSLNVVAMAALAPQHIHLLLTKRPERLLEIGVFDGEQIGWTARAIIKEHFDNSTRLQVEVFGPPPHCPTAPQPNLWVGTSVSTQADADKRIPELLKCPGKKFVSYEPAVGPVDFDADWLYGRWCGCGRHGDYCDCEHGEYPEPSTLDAVIIGGESGPKARPCEWMWLKSVADECQAADVPCFTKQWGANPIFGGLLMMPNLKSRKGDDPAEWPEPLPRELAWEVK